MINVRGRRKGNPSGIYPMAIKQLKDGRWACYYWREGKKKWEYFGRDDLARHRAEQRDEQVKRDKGKLRSKTGFTIAQLLNEYHQKHQVERTTRDTDFYRIDRILVPMLGDRAAEMLTSNDLDKYVAVRTKLGRAPLTIDRELDILKSAYAWAESREPPLIFHNPMARYRFLKSRPKTAKANPIPREDFHRLLQHAPTRLIRGMVLQWYGGQRPGRETLSILWLDVSFDNMEILIHSAHKGAPEERYIPIHPDLSPLLEAWKEDDRRQIAEGSLGLDIQTVPVVHYNFHPIGSLKTAWKATKERAGIHRKLRLYDFRHAWFTNALRRGADLKSTSEIGGHSRPDTTMIFYQTTTRDQHHEAVAKIPTVEIPPRLPTKRKKSP